MKEEDKTDEKQLEERGLAPTEKQEGGRPGNYGPEDGKELLDAARDLLKGWAEMRPEHRGLVLAAVDMDLAFNEDGFDVEAMRVNANATAIIGARCAANFAAVMAISEKQSLLLARMLLKHS